MADVIAFPVGPATATTVAPLSQAPLKRCAIVGTAPNWKMCPWQDQTLEVWGLNDGYLLGVPRANRWYDLHPTYQMSFQPQGHRIVAAEKTQPGMYLRPEGHLDWLKSRPFPVYLQQARPDWPNSRTFPGDALLAWFAPHWPLRMTKKGAIEAGRDYEASTPAWMLMQAIMEGYTEIHSYGINLATAWEYQIQRPNWEWLLGFCAGRDIKIVLPSTSPICHAKHRYAYEPKADIPIQIADAKQHAIKAEGLTLRQRHAKLPWHAFAVKADIEARLAVLDIDLLDARQESQRLQALSQLVM